MKPENRKRRTPGLYETGAGAKGADRPLEQPLAELGVSVRTINGLEEHGISTIGALLSCSRERLMSFANFGVKTMHELCRAVEAHDLEAPEDWLK